MPPTWSVIIAQLPSNRVLEPMTLITQLGQVILGEILMIGLHGSSTPLLILPPVPEPQEAVYHGCYPHHAERRRMSADESWPISGRALQR
jgi:hypothetical protein